MVDLPEHKKGWIEVMTLIGDLGFDDELNRRGILIDFRSDRRGAVRTEVFVFVALRQDQEQFLSHWDCRFTSRAVKRGCFKFLKASLLHGPIIKNNYERDNSAMLSAASPCTISLKQWSRRGIE